MAGGSESRLRPLSRVNHQVKLLRAISRRVGSTEIAVYFCLKLVGILNS
jgi:hypothetical protein